MTQLSEEQQERVKQIRERLAAHRQEVVKYQSHEWAKEGVLRYYEAPNDIDFLLSLLQVASDAATATRDKCVDAIKSLRAVPRSLAYNNAISDAIHKVESLTLDQVNQGEM